MIKCSFCEQPLICKSCGKPVHPRSGETHVGIYQPEMEISCPACRKVLVCKACGYLYGEASEPAENG